MWLSGSSRTLFNDCLKALGHDSTAEQPGARWRTAPEPAHFTGRAPSAAGGLAAPCWAAPPAAPAQVLRGLSRMWRARVIPGCEYGIASGVLRGCAIAGGNEAFSPRAATVQ
jgi:hypothetical protein